MTDFASIMRRIITGDDASGDSVVIIDGPPSATNGDPDVGGLFDIWHDDASGPLDPRHPSRSRTGALRALARRRAR